MAYYYSRTPAIFGRVVLAYRRPTGWGGLALELSEGAHVVQQYIALANCIIGEELLIFLMPQTSIRHVSFHGFDYSKQLYVYRIHLLYLNNSNDSNISINCIHITFAK